MSAAILSFAKANESDLAAYQSGEFRRATRNMILGFAAAKTAVDKLKEKLNSPLNMDKTALIFGSSYGELCATRDFLWHLTTSKMARPLLFQNSLHNATLGFLCERLGLRGPSATVSQRYFTAEKSLDLALTLLDSQICESAIVVTAECHAPDLKPILQQIYPNGTNLRDGSAAVVLSRDLTQENFGILRGVQYSDQRNGSHQMSLGYYDSDGLEELIAHLPSSTDVRLNKPDQSSAVMQLSEQKFPVQLS